MSDGESSNYKKKKLKEQKAQASSSHNWNTLFLGTNAVATLMAERYDTTKQQVIITFKMIGKLCSIFKTIFTGPTRRW